MVSRGDAVRIYKSLQIADRVITISVLVWLRDSFINDVRQPIQRVPLIPDATGDVGTVKAGKITIGVVLVIENIGPAAIGNGLGFQPMPVVVVVHRRFVMRRM